MTKHVLNVYVHKTFAAIFKRRLKYQYWQSNNSSVVKYCEAYVWRSIYALRQFFLDINLL